MEFVEASTKPGSGRAALESAHRLVSALDAAMILLNPVVEITIDGAHVRRVPCGSPSGNCRVRPSSPGPVTVERRWLVISEDGRYSTLGRNSDPTEEEIRSVEAALVVAGTGGWLAVTHGIYHSRGKLEVLRVRVLRKPTAGWETAVAQFLEIRKRAVN